MPSIPFLSKLGVVPQAQARSPTADAFPVAFNVNNKRLWEAILMNYVSTGNALLDWTNVIDLYVDACAKKGTYAFSNIKQSTNDQIFSFLSEKRRDVVNFINKIHLMDIVALRDSKRKVNMTTAGFTLEVHSRATPRDPTIEKWLLKTPYPRFDNVRQADGKWVKTLSKDLTFWFRNEGANMTQRWEVGYTINCPFYPDIPGKPLASKQELERFILSVVWDPIIRMQRPIGVLHRLL